MFKRLFSIFLVVSVFVVSQPLISAKSNTLDITAKAAIVVNAKTGQVIYSKNANMRLPMASTTKIMTAVLLLENADLEKEITTTKEMVTVEGSSMGLLVGDRVTYHSLLYGMMLPSGNDAATTVAISLSGSLKEFALLMNKKAQTLSMNNTNFVTPSGLDDKYHYSTAEDMAKLSVYAMKNPKFRKVVSTEKIRLEYGNPPYSRMLFGHNKILKNYSGANGIKTGYTSKSGKCLVSSAKRGNHEVIAVTLNDPNTTLNHQKLLDYGFSKLNDTVLKLPEDFKEIEVISANKSFCNIASEEKVVSLTATEAEKLNYKVYLEPFVYAPIKKDEKVGRIDFYVGSTFLDSLDIKTLESVEKQKMKETTFLERLLQYIILFV